MSSAVSNLIGCERVGTAKPPKQPVRILRNLLLLLCAVVLTTSVYNDFIRSKADKNRFGLQVVGNKGNKSVKERTRGKQEYIDIAKGSWKPLWSWVCEEDRYCVRTTFPPAGALPPPPLQSWLTCVMLCSLPPLWPQPTGLQHYATAILTLRKPPYKLSITSAPSEAVIDYLERAFDLFNQDIQKSRKKYHVKNNKITSRQTITINNKFYTGPPRRLLVKIKVTSDPDPRLRLDTFEGYKLVIKDNNVTLIANIFAESFCGARHALETLSQLVWFDEYLGSFVTFQSALISDRPKFVYRGLMLDTARNYFPVEDILRTLDAMAASKLNTFHWHATDYQSFPLKLKSVPQFAWFGAYSRRDVYTPENIQTIVHRARLRGIRVVIEIDGPAHVGRAWSWADRMGRGQITTCLQKRPWQVCGQPPCGQLNPLNPHVYNILRQVFTEIIQLTDVHDVFHIGGDEVIHVCWEKKRVHEKWMIYINQTKRVLKIANGGKLPEAMILWSSDFTRKPFDKDLVIQVWDGDVDQRKIVSDVNAWYLDCGFGSWWSPFDHVCQYNNESSMYSREIGGKALGGEACLWSELVSRGSLDSRLWPRGAAVAERLWANPSRDLDAIVAAMRRLDLHRRRLVARGVAATALWSRWCSDNPFECTTKLLV